jgi:hypothetical protein
VLKSDPPITILRAASGLVLAFAATVSAPTAVWADEGMWTFDKIPVERIKAATGVTLDQAWLDAAQASAVRLTTGCSAGLVSGQGLAITNSHCVADCAQALSTSDGQDYVQDGFLTDGRDEERKCAGIQAEVLLSIIDVTDQVRGAVAGKTGRDFVRTRDGTMAVAELAACGMDQTLRCQAIGFFRGGQYKVYKYRRYNDVRLVFMPEMASAAFGGDPDNFNFPRYAFDVAFVRLYVDGKPAVTRDHLDWRDTPPAPGEPTFVVGNPGSTERQLTVAQLETQRDLVLPLAQLQRAELRGRLIQFGQESAEHARVASQALAWVQNSYKLGLGKQLTLNDKAFLDAKRADEDALRAKVAADPALAAQTGQAWDDIAQAQHAAAELFLPWRMLEYGGNSELYYYARLLVRAAQEREKPDAERLPEYVDARLPLIERKLADAPMIDPAVERIYLEHWLLKTREVLTVDAPQVRALLGRERPEQIAKALAETQLADPETRMALWKGGLEAIKASDDPLVRFILRVDPIAREARAAYETQVSGPVDIAAEKVAKARFAALGDSTYPDATFSLRLSYGKVAGWEARGRAIPATTDFAGFYDRVTGVDPFAAAPRWLEAKDQLKSDTVFDFVSTNDIVGGNSGSPVLDAAGRLIGVAFDGNLPSLGGAYGYDGTRNRTVSLSAVAITQALDKVYDRADLVKELTGR